MKQNCQADKGGEEVAEWGEIQDEFDAEAVGDRAERHHSQAGDAPDAANNNADSATEVGGSCASCHSDHKRVTGK